MPWRHRPREDQTALAAMAHAGMVLTRPTGVKNAAGQTTGFARQLGVALPISAAMTREVPRFCAICGTLMTCWPIFVPTDTLAGWLPRIRPSGIRGMG
jgi:hypothetical protein